MKNWYLVHTKIRQESLAQEHLSRQGYTCFLPVARAERIRQGKISLVQEALFPRYLFVQLGDEMQDMSWAPIRSSIGVSRLVSFGQVPAKVSEDVISALKAQCSSGMIKHRQFESGDVVSITKGPFRGVDAIFQTTDPDGRIVILFELISKPVRMSVAPDAVKKI